MTQETIAPGSWRIHLLVTGGVLFTVLLALLLAQLDSLQRQILPSPVAQALANLNATPTNTPLPAIPLATGTPTPSLSNTPFNNDSDTAVAMLPNCGSVPPGWLLTPVAPDETLLTLSLRYNISTEKIRLANCLEPGSLVNTTLYLPGLAATANPTAVCGPPQNWLLYTVRRGDTMFRLSLQYGTTITAILNANCLASTSLQAGQRIYLPPGTTLPPTVIIASTTPTPTGTSTSTATATGTSTSTPTNTVPPLPTSSVTATSTATGTATGTPTATATASLTPTISVTPTITNTPSASPTASSTPSATATASATNSPSPTASATPTNSPVPTATATDTAVPTATPTPSATP